MANEPHTVGTIVDRRYRLKREIARWAKVAKEAGIKPVD